MKKEGIKKIAEEKIKERVKLTEQGYLESLDQRYVKIIKDRGKPGKVELKKAWVARFIDNGRYKGAWVELTIDEKGNIIRIDQSR